MTDNLADWLLRQLDELTKELADPGVPGSASVALNGGPPYTYWSKEAALKDLHAKQRIVERHRPRVAEQGPYKGTLICGCSDGSDEYLATPWPCADVRDIACMLDYRPGYREEWRP